MTGNKFIKNKDQFIPTDLGKMPPTAIEIEESILGTIMLYENSMTICIQYLKPESFYKDAHQKIYSACLDLFNDGKRIDILTVKEKLKANKTLDEIGGTHYLASLTNVPSSQAANIEVHCTIVAEKFIRRELIRITNEINSKAYDDEFYAQDLIDSAGMYLIGLTSDIGLNSVIRIGQAINNQVRIIEKISSGEIKFTGIPSGLTSIDRKTCGWQNSDLIILAGRPSMGKTALALKFAKEPALLNIPVIFFSLEMSVDQLANRYISGETDITQMELRRGEVSDWKRIEKTVTKFEKVPLFIDDKSSLSVAQIRSRIIMYKQKFGIKLAIIDYLQLIKGSKNNREQEISDISRTLKQCAKELDIPIIALSQLNRSVENRPDKRPMLSDLRESGAIEQDADLVMFILRPEKYGILQDEEGESTKGITIVIFAKFRNGSQSDVVLKNNLSLTEFYDKDFMPELNSLPIPSESDFYINKNIETHKDEPF